MNFAFAITLQTKIVFLSFLIIFSFWKIHDLFVVTLADLVFSGDFVKAAAWLIQTDDFQEQIVIKKTLKDKIVDGKRSEIEELPYRHALNCTIDEYTLQNRQDKVEFRQSTLPTPYFVVPLCKFRIFKEKPEQKLNE